MVLAGGDLDDFSEHAAVVRPRPLQSRDVQVLGLQLADMVGIERLVRIVSRSRQAPGGVVGADSASLGQSVDGHFSHRRPAGALDLGIDDFRSSCQVARQL